MRGGQAARVGLVVEGRESPSIPSFPPSAGQLIAQSPYRFACGCTGKERRLRHTDSYLAPSTFSLE